MSEEKETPKPAAPQPAQDEKKSDQEAARKEKIRKLIEAGVEIFPYRYDWTHSVSDIAARWTGSSAQELDSGKIEVRVPGRIMAVRRMGRATFLHISDGRSRLQAYFREDLLGKKDYDLFGLMDIGDVIGLSGKLFKTKTGELTVLASGFQLLAKCHHPLPEKWHGLQDVELRYRKRYLDLIMNPEVNQVFLLRGRLVSELRKFFDGLGYVEVETPMMQPIAGGAIAKPFKTYHNALGIDLYLRIAPELYLKRLVVGGLEKVYEINRNFRNEGISTMHNPEFTMLEFYQAYSDYFELMDMTEELICLLADKILGKQELRFGGKPISLKRPWKRLRFMEALQHFSGLAPGRISDREGLVQFAATLAGEGVKLTYGKALDVVFDRFVKPNLVDPTFIINPPKEISPLAKASRDNPEEAERFELMMAGMEIANAFSELTDPDEQRRRFEQQAEDRGKGDEEAHPVDMDYVQALEYGLPPTAGEGIGVDRLAMLFADKTSIREVILFPLLKPR